MNDGLWVPNTITKADLALGTATIIRKCNREWAWITATAFLSGVSVGAWLMSVLS